MFIAMNRICVRKGEGAELVERFSQSSGLEEQPGFVRFRMLMQSWSMSKDGPGETDEYISMTEWESADAFFTWTRSDAFKKAHSRGRLDAIVSSQPCGYDVVLERS